MGPAQPSESVVMMLKFIDNLKPEDLGKFLSPKVSSPSWKMSSLLELPITLGKPQIFVDLLVINMVHVSVRIPCSATASIGGIPSIASFDIASVFMDSQHKREAGIQTYHHEFKLILRILLKSPSFLGSNSG